MRLSLAIVSLAGIASLAPDLVAAPIVTGLHGKHPLDETQVGRVLLSELGCVACHKVGNIGGIIGPDLSALGSGVPFDRIVTEVMWPTLQVKEGYSLTRVVTKKSQTLQGYEQASRDENKILLRDFAGAGMHRISRDDIEKVEKIGSLMPPTAQILSKNDIADLLAYLFSLRG